MNPAAGAGCPKSGALTGREFDKMLLSGRLLAGKTVLLLPPLQGHLGRLSSLRCSGSVSCPAVCQYVLLIMDEDMPPA